MKKMIELEVLDLEWLDGYRTRGRDGYHLKGSTKTLFDPNVIAEVQPVRKGQMLDDESGLEFAVMYTVNQHGLGINGVTTRHCITAESYQKLIGLFEIL